MDVYLNISSEYSDGQVKDSADLINESIENHGIFQGEIPNVVDSHLKEINVLLQKVTTRNEGFELLLPLIQQGSPQLIEKRIEHWFGVCCQTVISLRGVSEKINACRIIIFLLKASPNFPELQKSYLGKSHASFIQNLATADYSWNCAALDCLWELLKLIPGQCLPQKVVIEENMLKYLDMPLSRVGQEDVVKKAGKVYAALPLPGMGGNKTQGRAEARGKQVTQLLALAHNTMDVLFDGIVEKESYKHTRECALKVSRIKLGGQKSADTVRGILAAMTRLGNTLKFVSQLLTSENIESISIVPYHLLGPLFRLLQVDSKVLKSYRSQEHQLLSFLIVSLHHHCLLLLRDLIISIGEGIDMYFGVISDLLVSVIKMSFADDDDDESTWCANGIQTRIIAYSVMATVMQTSRGRHTPSKDLVNLLLKDIIPKSHQVTLQKTPRKGLESLTVQKRKKKKGYLINQCGGTNHSGPFFQTEPLCRVTRSALSLAEVLLACASHSLSHKAKKKLQINILSVVEIVTGGAILPEAYTCSKTRSQMYRAIASIANHPDPRCPPPYTMILYLLQRGQEDQQALVVTTCQALMGNVSFILANPQISHMDMILQHSRIPNGDGLEEDDEEAGLTKIISKQHQRDDDSAEEEDNPEIEEEEETTEEKVQVESSGAAEDLIAEETEEKVPEAVKENGDGGDNLTDEEDAEDAEETKDVKDEDLNVSDNESAIVITKSEKKMKKKVSPSKKLSEITPSPAKRKKKGETSPVNSKKSKTKESTPVRSKMSETKESTPVSSKKSTTKANEISSDGPTLETMMNSFVDADPDE